MAAVKVRYKGLSDIREISQKHLKSLGVNVPDDLVWSRRNDFTIEVEGSDRLVAILKDEGHFTISEVKDGSGDGSTVTEATDLSEKGELVDATTGARTRKS